MANPRGHVATIQPAPNGQPAGAQGRATTHGAHSEHALQPLREHHGRELRQDFPWLDGRRVALLAELLAKIDLGSAFIARAEANLINRKSKRATPIAVDVDKWEARAWTLLREVQAEAREHHRGGNDLEAHLRKRQEGN